MTLPSIFLPFFFCFLSLVCRFDEFFTLSGDFFFPWVTHLIINIYGIVTTVLLVVDSTVWTAIPVDQAALGC